MRKLVWAKFKSSFQSTGRIPKERRNSFNDELNVNEEYKKAFRTKSYLEMWTKVQGQLKTTDCEGIDRVSLSSSSSHVPFNIHLSDYLFEPQQQEPFKQMIESFRYHELLIDYFESSLESCNICELLLRCIHQTRSNYQRIRKVIKLSKRLQHPGEHTDKTCGAIFRELSAFSLLKNPLSYVSSLQFREIHDSNITLLHRLTSQQRNIRRRAKFNRFCKKIGGYALVISHTALVIALLIIALHSMVGIFAAPGLVCCSLCLFKKKMRSIHGRFKTSLLEKFHAQLDLASKGTFILINDFDTLSRLVKRLYDEIEHRKALADMCVRHKKPELLKEVLKEFHVQDPYYLEQIQELEQHIYLCFHTINRSRRLVMQEIMVDQ
ncbi:hypothetical protein K2173_007370 [Erythroxylum novogranatense]|uniref:Uncharacterized protein n=1 Tax=Erythroxylum novogranatense TaxID=1862640 RepID=A0AAV8T784_9ROSI|nr:hypothetical protein K2173_007370 [Erythroxylum novogranatense]